MSDTSKYFYTNGVDLTMSPYDLTFRFVRNNVRATKRLEAGEIEEAAPTVEDEFFIGMSAAHAKAMLPALFHTIRQYEEKFGKLAMLPELQKVWDETFVGKKNADN